MDDVAVEGTAEAEHVGDVLGGLERQARRGVETAVGGAAVEALVDPVAVGGRHRPVEEVAGQQLDLSAGARQRRRKRAVVRWRECRRVDYLNFRMSRWRYFPGKVGGSLRRVRIKWTATGDAPLLSYLVVNTNGREYLLACLAAIERTHPGGVEREILVLDNASEDGSAEAVRALGGEIRLIALERRTGKARERLDPDARGAGEYCLLLNEDSELRPGATAALLEAMEAEPKAAAATPQLLDSERQARPLRLALPRRRHGRDRSALPPPSLHRAEQGRRPGGSTGRSRAR